MRQYQSFQQRANPSLAFVLAQSAGILPVPKEGSLVSNAARMAARPNIYAGTN
ncbi:MAG: hypothetical protein IT342_02450 [Candidatus Melainabacteria bacterium]|nr:hypothetical protein [Candidatus Melainabacteria bacterium]